MVLIAIGATMPRIPNKLDVQHYTLPDGMDQDKATCLMNGGNYYQYPEPTCVFLYS